MELATRPSLENIRQAADRIRDVIVETPLVPLHSFESTSDILLKPEIHQAVTSFKLRGVFNAVASLSDEERQKGLSTVSAGNTAQALAWAARYFGVPARSLMPESAPRSKIEAVRAYGATPVLVPVDELFRYLREHGWESEPYAYIHPWTDRNVMLGHASIGLEVLADCPDVDSVFVSVGGGGLIAGVASALKALKPSVKVIAVDRWEGREFENVALDRSHTWLYRGQVIPTDRVVTVEAAVTSVDPAERILTANGTLSIDGRTIHQMKDFTLRAL